MSSVYWNRKSLSSAYYYRKDVGRLSLQTFGTRSTSSHMPKYVRTYCTCYATHKKRKSALKSPCYARNYSSFKQVFTRRDSIISQNCLFVYVIWLRGRLKPTLTYNLPYVISWRRTGIIYGNFQLSYLTLETAELREIYKCREYIKLTPWLMEPEGSMPHSQGLSNNPYPEPNQPNYPH